LGKKQRLKSTKIRKVINKNKLVNNNKLKHRLMSKIFQGKTNNFEKKRLQYKKMKKLRIKNEKNIRN